MPCLCCCLLFAVLGRFSLNTTCDVMNQVAYNIRRHLMQYLLVGHREGELINPDKYTGILHYT